MSYWVRISLSPIADLHIRRGKFRHRLIERRTPCEDTEAQKHTGTKKAVC
jgi:hypothetical protein